MGVPSIGEHIEALEADEARHNLILSILEMARTEPERDVMVFSMGAPGECAVQMPRRNIVLGALREPQCRALAEDVTMRAYPGVVGTGLTAEWFVERASDLGHCFDEPMPQRIYALSGPPENTSAEGRFRSIAPRDAERVAGWVLAFIDEAVPLDPKPERKQLEETVVAEPYFLWECGGEPVSMAKIARTTRHCATISLVYTPPELRGRGFASAVTAGVVRAAFERGKTVACLYTDLRNPVSNRVYTGIGFEPLCDACFYPRILD